MFSLVTGEIITEDIVTAPTASPHGSTASPHGFHVSVWDLRSRMAKVLTLATKAVEGKARALAYGCRQWKHKARVVS